jgi:hypothetical protein
MTIVGLSPITSYLEGNQHNRTLCAVLRRRSHWCASSTVVVRNTQTHKDARASVSVRVCVRVCVRGRGGGGGPAKRPTARGEGAGGVDVEGMTNPNPSWCCQMCTVRGPPEFDCCCCCCGLPNGL